MTKTVVKSGMNENINDNELQWTNNDNGTESFHSIKPHSFFIKYIQSEPAKNENAMEKLMHARAKRKCT